MKGNEPWTDEQLGQIGVIEDLSWKKILISICGAILSPLAVLKIARYHIKDFGNCGEH